MRTVLKRIISAVALCIAASEALNAIPARPEPARLVNDFAGIFSPGQAMQLERMLTAFDDSTSNQIAVVTVSDLEGYSASGYATQIGLDWGIGAASHDNGVVVLIKPKYGDSYGDVAISTGYGLEGAIPDIYCKRIIDSEMIPHFAAGDYYAGTVSGCRVLMQLASGEISIIFFAILGSNGKGGRGGNNGGSGGVDADDLIRGIILGNILSGRGHRGGHPGGFNGGFDGGGFSGGGFGGFGGGDFGGGGASGRW